MQLEKPDFTELLYLLADSFKARISNPQFSLQPVYGKGYFWAEKLPSGITVITSDTSLKEDLIIDLSKTNEEFFILQFNEEAADETMVVLKNKGNDTEFESSVKLSHTSLPESFVFPKAKRLRSVKFFFSKNHLSSILGREIVEKILNIYFPLQMRNATIEPIATEYRVMLDDLWTDELSQPLKLNYIQNRIFLLLEKYIIKLLCRSDIQGKKT